MRDAYNREIDYMRISITDRCNLRCRYCMPEDIKNIPMTELLTYEEITQIVKIAVTLGIRKIKITGGEPLVRKDVDCLIRMLKETEGIENVTMTTNGVLLAEKIQELREAGLDGVNVSLDTVDKDEFQKITGQDALEQVLEGIEVAIENIPYVKINTVLRPELTKQQLLRLTEYVQSKKIDTRFIELMPIGLGKKENGMSGEQVFCILEEQYGTFIKNVNRHGNGPAVYYDNPEFVGNVGFISALHGKFCSTCNRIRMNAVGGIKPCLCYGETSNLKEPLRNGDSGRVKEIIREAIQSKPKEHCFNRPEQITEKQRMSSIGG